MNLSRWIIEIVSTFAALLFLGCAVVRTMPIGTVEGAIVYMAAVVGTIALSAAHERNGKK